MKQDIKKFEATEDMFVQQFGGERITDSRQWTIDADCLLKGKTVSIKDQLKSSAKTGNITVETKTVNPKTKEEKLGFLYYNKTDYYAWLVSYKDQEIWLVCPSSFFKSFVENNYHYQFKTNPDTVEKNIKQGWKFAEGHGLLLKIEKLINSPEVKKIKLKKIGE